MSVLPGPDAAPRQSNRSALVVGAGIVGVSCALQLQHRGIQVTLIDRDEPGLQCSFGNAARIASASCMPRSVPGFIWKVPGMLARPWHPLKVSPAHLLRSFPWFWRFVRSGNPKQVRAAADALGALCSRADTAFDDLVKMADASDLVRRNGWMSVYADPANLAGARRSAKYATDRGLVLKELSGDAARELEPGLPKNVHTAFYRPNEALVVSPLKLTQRLVARFMELGGNIERSSVTGFTQHNDPARNAPTVHTSGGERRADTVVVATGAWTEGIARQLGISIPIQAERGYHAEIENPGIELTMPLSLADRYVSVSPMDDCLRIGSGAQFAPVDEPGDWRRLEHVLESARSYYPELRTDKHTRWVGGRPSTPDSLPVIGASARQPHVLFAGGHGMIGLTLSAITAELIGTLAVGESPGVDLTPYRPDRFS